MLFLLCFSLCLFTTSFAQTENLYGIVTDSLNGELLTGCNVYVIDQTSGVVTNSYGYYSVALSKGKHQLVFSFVGYRVDTFEIDLKYDLNYPVRLVPLNSKLTGVSIIAQKGLQYAINRENLNIEKVKSMPVVMGTPDVLKSMQLLPGVQTTNEGTVNLSIRGGSHDQNLILLDEAPVYNPGHALSLVSVFNVDAIKSASLYKGYFPAEYGGRLSSVIELRMKEGNNKKLSLSGGVGLIASRLTLEFPIVKNKASVLISGRYGYPGSALNAVSLLNANPYMNIKALNNIPQDNVVWFYDINFKVNYQLSKNNRFYISLYSSKDEFELQPLDAKRNLKWGNNTLTARWNHIQNSRVFVNHTIYYSNYDYSYSRIEEVNNFIWSSGLQEVNYKLDIDYYLSKNNHFKYGGLLGYHKYMPGEISKAGANSSYNSFSLHKQQTLNFDFYISDELTLSEKVKINFGLRYSSMMNIGPDQIYVYDDEMKNVLDTISYGEGDIIKYHFGLEPRFTASYLFNKRSYLQVSYGRTRQQVHQLSNSSVGLPTDVWLPANTYINPAISNQYSIGYYNSIGKSNIKSSIEVYYRNMNDIIDFVDNADLFLNDQIETQVLMGKRVAYGAEFMLKKEVGKLQGWVSYTLSKVDQQVDGINDDKWYPAYFDKRHNLSVLLSYKLFSCLKVNTVFKFTSGGNATVPIELFYFNGVPFVEYSDRNAYKLPNYHRLDISFTYESVKNTKRAWKSLWTIGAYNVYNRKNVFSIDAHFVNSKYQWDYYIEVNKIYLYGIVPYISYQFRI
jgi:hypothetical protein